MAVHNMPWLVMTLMGVAFAAFIFYLWKVFSYADKHPDHAVSEGAELMRIQEIQQASRDPKVLDLTSEPAANTAPPIAIGSGKRDD